MAYWDMHKKMQGHPALQAGETPVATVYGLGEGMLAAADAASRSLRPPPTQPMSTGGYSDEYDEAVQGRDAHGFATEVSGNGVLALTDRRLLFFKKATVAGAPKEVTAEISASLVVGASYDKPMLTVEFADESAIGMHVPRNQKPDAFVAAVTEARQ